jgi:hypothetical protein
MWAARLPDSTHHFPHTRDGERQKVQASPGKIVPTKPFSLAWQVIRQRTPNAKDGATDAVSGRRPESKTRANNAPNCESDLGEHIGAGEDH